MIDLDRYRKIKTLQDIKLEKARLRYEMLLAENRLSESIETIYGLFTAPALLARASEVFSYAQKVYSAFQNAWGWLFRKKHRSAENESSD